MSRRALPVHEVANNMDPDLIDVLPAVHALTGCGTTSKVITKLTAFQTAATHGYKGMIESAEEFLVHCIDNKSQVRNFVDLRNEVYHKK